MFGLVSSCVCDGSGQGVAAVVGSGSVLHKGEVLCVEAVVGDASVTECGAEDATCGITPVERGY